MANKRPSKEKIVEAILASGASEQQAAESAAAIDLELQYSPDANDYLKEFNNKIVQVWNDTHSNATIYDMFKKSTDAPTVQAVVYERIAPVTFDFNTDISELDADEHEFTRKIPAIHSILRSINTEKRFKTTSSYQEMRKLNSSTAVSINNVVENLGASYSDYYTDKFIALVDNIEGNKTSDEINDMSELLKVSAFIQKIKFYTFKFKEKRTDLYNAFAPENDPTAKSDTKLESGMRPVCFIDPQKLYKIEGDYYSTLYKLQEALPDVDFVEIDGLTDNKFAILADPRVIEWSEFNYELRNDQIPGRQEGELNHYLFTADILATFNCFNRVVFRTEAAANGD